MSFYTADDSMTIGINFFHSEDMTIAVGPLVITSINTEYEDWGSFEILWNNKWYLYCCYYQEIDPYKYKYTGYGEPVWDINLITGRKTLWTSSKYLYPIWDWYNKIKKIFIK